MKTIYKNNEDILSNIDKIHTTTLGLKRISKNLNIKEEESISYCKKVIKRKDTKIYKDGKNYYCENKNIKITINSYNYSIITAHIIK